MAFNPLDFLKDLVPQNTNMFGASPNANMKKMYDMGLLGDTDYTDMLAKANKQSIFQGLLGAGLSYAAQPKNQGYGSVLPYLAKAGLAGVQAAQNPYDQMGKDAAMNQKLTEMQRAQVEQKRIEGQRTSFDDFAKNGLYATTGATKTQLPYEPITQTNIQGAQTPIAPNFTTRPITETGGEQTLDIQKLSQFVLQHPDNPYATKTLQNLKTQAEIAKLNKEANAGPGLNLAKVDSSKVSGESYQRYTDPSDPMYGNPNVLDGKTDKDKMQIEEIKAKMKYEYGVGDSLPAQGMDKTVKQNIEKGNNASEITLPYSGQKAIPRIYKPGVPGKTILKLEDERNDRTYTLRQGADSLRQERKKIRDVVNSGALYRITGVVGQFKSFPGSKAADAEALLETIKQKEFLNNYLGIKKAGGGFGALSEKEGERLENMRVSLNNAQSPEQIEKVLLELDDILEREEQSLYEGYASDYGTYDYKPIQLDDFGKANTNSADEELVNKYIL